MTSKDICPLCGADFAYGETGQYSRQIGVEIQGVYHGVLFWQCPDCGSRWHRFAETDPYYERAARYIQNRPSIPAQKRARTTKQGV